MDISLNSQNISDQKTLYHIESLCTQEEPPACVAMCPVHVNAKQINDLVRKRDFDGAYAIYSKTIPFPNIIAHICDSPCKSKCKREEKGGGIHMQKIELAVVRNTSKGAAPQLFLPKKSQSVAVIGGGLRGMTAAYDLAKKGYKVTVFEKTHRLGGSLWAFDESKLPGKVIEKDLNALLKLPLSVNYNSPIDCNSKEGIRGFLQENHFDALYISCGNILEKEAPKDTLQTSIANVFSGEREGTPEKESPIFDFYNGRSAASSMDRFLQNVSLMHGREKEGAYETKLYTDLQHVESRGEEDDPMEEAKRCIQCTCEECTKRCAFMAHYKSYPKRYVREVFNNLSIVMGDHPANKIINACSLCGECGNVCPNGLNMEDVFLAARQRMVEYKKMPPKFEFALLDLEQSMLQYFLAQHQEGFDKSEYIFFPGCQLSASEPKLTENVYLDLCSKMYGGVGIILSCCGIIAHWAGEKAIYQNAVEKIRATLSNMGNPRIITACPTCQTALKEFNPISIWDILIDFSLRPVEGETYTVYDACAVRNNEKVHKTIRDVAEKIGLTIQELPESKNTSCCGYGGLTLYAYPEISDEMAVSHMEDTNKKYLTYCINCRDRFLANGGNSAHLLELLYKDVNLKRKAPTWSEREENKAALKRRLAKEEYIAAKPLYMDEVMSKILEERRILLSDIEKTIEYAEQENRILKDTKTGHFISSFRPKNVTFWIEYEPFEDGYRIYNAYSHRMDANYLISDREEQDYDAGIKDSEQLRCICCDKPLALDSVNLSYLNNGFPVKLLCCNTCGLIYIPEDLALGKMLHVEKSLEDK